MFLGLHFESMLATVTVTVTSIILSRLINVSFGAAGTMKTVDRELDKV